MSESSPEILKAACDHRVGAVVIGRNEGDRLIRSLVSLSALMPRVVYVDSGSSDGSMIAAAARGATAVALDMSTPFAAGRARNEGFDALRARFPGVEFVQFIDGDCELVSGWLDAAIEAMERDRQLGVVCGRRRERDARASIYNALCDMEWNTPVGLTGSCGGDFLCRVEAFESVLGFDPGLICGEEPDLCARLAAAGWKIRRLPDEMTRHDAAILSIRQWWRRTCRTGFGYAAAAFKRGITPRGHYGRRAVSAIVYGLGLPLATAVALGLGVAYRPLLWLALAPIMLFGLIVVRASASRARRGERMASSLLFGVFCALGKLPEAQGVVRYWLSRLSGRRQEIIEYK